MSILASSYMRPGHMVSRKHMETGELTLPPARSIVFGGRVEGKQVKLMLVATRHPDAFRVDADAVKPSIARRIRDGEWRAVKVEHLHALPPTLGDEQASLCHCDAGRVNELPRTRATLTEAAPKGAVAQIKHGDAMIPCVGDEELVAMDGNVARLVEFARTTAFDRIAVLVARLADVPLERQGRLLEDGDAVVPPLGDEQVVAHDEKALRVVELALAAPKPTRTSDLGAIRQAPGGDRVRSRRLRHVDGIAAHGHTCGSLESIDRAQRLCLRVEQLHSAVLPFDDTKQTTRGLRQVARRVELAKPAALRANGADVPEDVLTPREDGGICVGGEQQCQRNPHAP
eukprot:CAMPEP_0205869454 /NCGR_PEP_ID=MMETSP1083-20121108/10020_1 /ASSEMBLY_ACC=CAM_ASM_000430 /TAXON_ID=97485 /ORGANISM="Prymnesium parvum, Strain Texoma1" /LENGTH=342 /DNA_ID=CAMNT_0053231643 /DNA_START=455 /DNA_END=1480 /DNA_ORIENTATION=-